MHAPLRTLTLSHPTPLCHPLIKHKQKIGPRRTYDTRRSGTGVTGASLRLQTRSSLLRRRTGGLLLTSTELGALGRDLGVQHVSDFFILWFGFIMIKDSRDNRPRDHDSKVYSVVKGVQPDSRPGRGGAERSGAAPAGS